MGHRTNLILPRISKLAHFAISLVSEIITVCMHRVVSFRPCPWTNLWCIVQNRLFPGTLLILRVYQSPNDRKFLSFYHTPTLSLIFLWNQTIALHTPAQL